VRLLCVNVSDRYGVDKPSIHTPNEYALCVSYYWLCCFNDFFDYSLTQSFWGNRVNYGVIDMRYLDSQDHLFLNGLLFTAVGSIGTLLGGGTPTFIIMNIGVYTAWLSIFVC